MPKHTIGKQLQIADTVDGDKSATVTQIETIDHSFLPLPSAEEFRSFEETCPGAAERILILVEKQFEHRCKQETVQQDEDNKLRSIGVVIGFLTIIIFACVAIILALCGRQYEALASIVSPMIVFAIAALRYTVQK